MWKHFRFNPDSVHFSCHTDKQFNEFDLLLHSEWDRATTQGLFSFQIDHNAKRRILEDGNLQYIIELNPGRYANRRAPYPFENINTPFDKNKFNFNKIKDSEVLFSLDNEEDVNKHLVIINNSPIRPYHVLLVPHRELEQPQILTIDCIIFGLQFLASSAYPYLFVGFNSLCGYASMNHLHLHGMYIPGRLFIQTIGCSLFHEKSNCYMLDFSDTQAFGFQARHIDEFEKIACYVYKIAAYLSEKNIAHNVGIVKGDSFSSPSSDVLRIFIWFRQSITNGKMFERCNFACVELSGFMPLPYENVFDELTEMEMHQHLNSIALPMKEQERIRNDVKSLLDD